MIRNPGHLPAAAIGRRVNVRLRNGHVHQGWAADGRLGCRWSLTGSEFDILEWELAG